VDGLWLWQAHCEAGRGNSRRGSYNRHKLTIPDCGGRSWRGAEREDRGRFGSSR
jgi:hypothetical protein